jgi:hypothetical protein
MRFWEQQLHSLIEDRKAYLVAKDRIRELEVQVASLQSEKTMAIRESEEIAGHEFGLWPMCAVWAISHTRKDRDYYRQQVIEDDKVIEAMGVELDNWHKIADERSAEIARLHNWRKVAEGLYDALHNLTCYVPGKILMELTDVDDAQSGYNKAKAAEGR